MNDDTEIIALLQDSARHFINDHNEAAHSPFQVLGNMAELGWTGLALNESRGGSGLGLQAATALTYLFGQAAFSTPLIGQCILPAIVLNHVPETSSQNTLLEGLCEQLVAGEQALALAWQEQAGQLPGSASENTIIANGLLNGRKLFVAGASFAQHLLVSATHNNQPCVVAVDKNTSGVSVSSDFENALGFATVTFSDVAIAQEAIILQAEDANTAINTALASAQIALAAQLAGLANGCLDKTLEYIKTRTQFKQALGSFQAIRHRCADMFMSNKLANSSWQRAVREYGNTPNDLSAQQIHAAKARCADAAFKVAKEAIQMHGAMGFTEEAGIGHYMRAALGLSSWLGSAQQHRHQLMLSNLQEA